MKGTKRLKATERFRRSKELGKGTFGTVWLAIDEETKAKVAVKQIKPGKFEDGVHWTALREIKLMRELKHENILALIEVFSSENHVNLVLQYCEFDLEKVILDKQPFKRGDVQAYLQMTLRGIEACHDAWVLHRDLKPQNLLLDSNGVLKLGDFGLARLYAEEPARIMSSVVVTLWYRAPELLFGAQQYGTGVDMWSIGLIFAELMTRVPVLKGTGEIDQLVKTFHLLGTPNEQDWPDCVLLPNYMEFTKTTPYPLNQIFQGESVEALDLLGRMLQLNPNKRPTAKEALEHPYFTGPNAVKPTHPSDLPKLLGNSTTVAQSIMH